MKFSINNGCFSYKGGRKLLRNVNLDVDSGDIAAILGPNGSGKTTLLRCSTGLLSWDSGASKLDDREIRAIPNRERWKLISYVRQAGKSTAAYTVEEMILLGRASQVNPLSKPAAEDIKAVERVLDDLDISHLAKKSCSHLSGGEFQMVLIARALVCDPKVLFLDEPESNLDFRNQLLVLNTLSALAQKGMTVIFNTHYPSHALRWANKALLLDGNGSAVCGSSSEIITEENIRSCFGVNACVQSFNTPGGILWDVLPVSIIKNSKEDNL